LPTDLRLAVPRPRDRQVHVEASVDLLMPTVLVGPGRPQGAFHGRAAWLHSPHRGWRYPRPVGRVCQAL